jgi:hypothetical protein
LRMVPPKMVMPEGEVKRVYGGGVTLSRCADFRTVCAGLAMFGDVWHASVPVSDTDACPFPSLRAGWVTMQGVKLAVLRINRVARTEPIGGIGQFLHCFGKEALA